MQHTATSNSPGRRIEIASTSQKTWSDSMLAELLQRMRDGNSRELLARLYGETPYRILKLRDQAERLERRGRERDPFSTLGSYARNSIISAGYQTPQQVRSALLDGTLGKATLLGPRRIYEIRQWLEAQVEAA